jgi:hypothetical protein
MANSKRKQTADPSSEQLSLPTRLHHFRWDLDKTYIRTDFDTTRDLVRTWLQPAEEKRGIPGARALLRELLRQNAEQTDVRRVTFISGSPRQMRKVLTRKLDLDGIRPDQFILKPNLSNLLLFRFKAIRSQIGYKVEALLQSRLFGEQVDETLFGDDAEQDALVYCLYADLIAGRIPPSQLEYILYATDVDSREADRILQLASHLDPMQSSRVRRIFIHMERRSPISRFDAFGTRVSPVYNWFQAALLLHTDGLLNDEALARVVSDMQEESYTPSRFTNSTRDLIHRALLTHAQADAAATAILSAASHMNQRDRALGESVASGLQTLTNTDILSVGGPQAIDYVRACGELRKYRREKLVFPRLAWLD